MSRSCAVCVISAASILILLSACGEKPESSGKGSRPASKASQGSVTKESQPATPSEAGASGTAAFFGTVTDESSQPVEGATVFASLMEASSRSGRTLGEAKTNAAGEFGFDPITLADGTSANNTFVVQKEGFALAGKVLFGSSGNKGDKPLRFTLEKPGTVEGTVTDPDGNPIASARLYPNAINAAAPYGENDIATYPGLERFSVKSDSDGRFRFDQMPASHKVGAIACHEDYATLFLLPDGSTPPFTVGQTDAKIVMPKSGRIEGDVAGEDTSKPAEGAKLRIGGMGYDPRYGMTWMGEAVTDKEGRYSFNHLPPMNDSLSGADAPSDPGIVMPKLAVPVALGQTVSGVNLKWSVGCLISGRVTDNRTGRPIGDVRVWCSSLDSNGQPIWNGSAPTNQEGRYTLHAPGGSLKLAVSGKGGEKIYSTLHDDLRIRDLQTKRGDKISDVDLQLVTLPALVIKGQVLDADGKPVEGATVRPGGGWKTRERRTDAEGHFEVRTTVELPDSFKNQDMAIYVLEGKKNLFGMAEVEDIAEGERQITVKMEPAGSVVGCIVGPDGKPPAKAQAQVVCQIQREGQGMIVPFGPPVAADPEGKFRVDCLGKGLTYRLICIADMTGRAESANFQALPGDTIDEGEMILPAADQYLGGYVTDPSGRPIPGAAIRVQGDNQPLGAGAGTDNTGKFRVGPLAKGAVRVSAVREGYAQAAVEAAVGDSSPTTITIQMTPDVSGASGPVSGAPAPPISDVKWLQGEDQVAKGKGRVVVVAFVSMASENSKSVLGTLKKLSEELGKKSPLIVAIHDATETESAIRAFVAEKELPFPIGRVADDQRQGWSSSAFTAWQVRSLPRVDIVGADQKLIAVDVRVRAADIESAVRAAAAGNAPSPKAAANGGADK